MYTIEYTRRALEDLKTFKKHEQNEILDAVDAQLVYEPMVETHNRKRMRPNPYAAWELRVGDFRVLYDVDEQVWIVEIQGVGEKRREGFFFRGRREDI